MCVFLGYTSVHRGYKCLHPSGRLYIDDTIHFNELEFPYPLLFSNGIPCSSPTDVSVTLPNLSSILVHIPPVIPSLPPSPMNRSFHLSSSAESFHSSAGSPHPSTSTSSPYSTSSSSSSSPQPQNTHHMLTRSKCGIFKPKHFVTPSQTHYLLHHITIELL